MPQRYSFINPMTKGELVCALIYLPLHVAGLPLLLSVLSVFVWPGLMSETDMNLIYYAVGVLYMFITLWGYYRRSFDALLDAPLRSLGALITGVLLFLAFSYFVSFLVALLGLELTSSPNDEVMQGMAKEGYYKAMALSVILAPLVEEPLFRGGVFGPLLKRSRALAYVASTLLFGLYHVWQFAVIDPSYLMYTLLYIPYGVALGACYERSGNIWTPIVFHMGSNLLAMSLV